MHAAIWSAAGGTHTRRAKSRPNAPKVHFHSPFPARHHPGQAPDDPFANQMIRPERLRRWKSRRETLWKLGKSPRRAYI